MVRRPKPLRYHQTGRIRLHALNPEHGQLNFRSHSMGQDKYVTSSTFPRVTSFQRVGCPRSCVFLQNLSYQHPYQMMTCSLIHHDLIRSLVLQIQRRYSCVLTYLKAVVTKYLDWPCLHRWPLQWFAFFFFCRLGFGRQTSTSTSYSSCTNHISTRSIAFWVTKHPNLCRLTWCFCPL